MPIPIIGDIVGAIGGIFQRLIPDKTTQVKLQGELEAIKVSGELNRILGEYGIATAEAQHRSVFVAGWRPSLGWLCTLCLALVWIPQFALGSYFWAVMCIKAHHVVEYPLNMKELYSLLGTLLINGGFRMFEKLKGVAR
jgi:hypothetical protein